MSHRTSKKSANTCTPTKMVSLNSKQHQLLHSPKCVKPPLVSVQAMTSRDFQVDTQAHIEVAAEQLKDYYSIRYFEAAILHNKHLFRGRTVLNIGCGMGLLSLLAAKAGAARVFAVDSSNVLDYTQQIVRDNGYAGVIQVIKGHIEQVQLPVDEVDIIVCNWLGYSLLFQSTCDVVIYARDKWLKKGGLIFPDVAKLFVAALEDSRNKNERVEWWNDVYGVNMKCLREFALSEPCYQMVQPTQIMSKEFGIKYLNLYKVTKEDLQFRCKFALDMRRTGYMDGIVTYFHVHFSKAHTPIGFSTDPCSPRTRWMQSVFYFDKPVHVKTGVMYYGGIEMRPKKGACDLNNMELGFEMFSGDPLQLHLETEMRWKLRPHAAVLNSESAANENETKTAVLHQRPDDQPGQVQQMSLESNELPKQVSAKVINAKKTKAPPSTIIGEHAYPCVVGKRGKKSKHAKKG